MADYVNRRLFIWLATSTFLVCSVQPAVSGILQRYFADSPCEGCCETRKQGHVIVQAEVIDCEITGSSTSVPSSTTSTPFKSSTEISSEPSSSSRKPTSVILSSSEQPSSSTMFTNSTSVSTTVSSTSRVTSIMSSSINPTKTTTTAPPDFTCSAGEICCETRTVGNVVVIAEVLEGPNIVCQAKNI